jgi:hypothetical protein
LQVDFRVDQCPRKGIYGGADTTSRAPDMRDSIAAQNSLNWIRDVIVKQIRIQRIDVVQVVI